ncbi:MAG: methyltransferase domain-containing protein [Chitinophagaceae bacterium]|nr:methyltransferase domain-containing protein [Chitinophagaceae bacterium]
MQYLWTHIRTLTDSYYGAVPFSHFIRNYTRQHPKLGSRDRKMLTTILYSWFRCSSGIVVPPQVANAFEVRVLACLRSCGVGGPAYDKLFAPFNIPDADVPPLKLENLFTEALPLSEGISKEQWLLSMTRQPRLFIRVIGSKDRICKVLNENNILFEEVAPSCLALPNGTPIDKILPETDYAVQDASSQYTGTFFSPAAGQQWYDCCCGAGGKSLLLMAEQPAVRLTVTDKRASIINNLKERFSRYGYRRPDALVADAADAAALSNTLGTRQFDNIICDVPCSGSGTWARTPEPLHFFNSEVQQKFPPLQRAIAVNVSKYLRPGGRLIYITCSVFRQENEEVVEHIVANTGLKVQHMQLINGISILADSMFIAVLQ